MLKPFLAALVFCLASQAHSETLRQFHAETSTPHAEIETALKQRMPTLVAPLGEGMTTVAYTGNNVPPALAGFLKASFETLDPKVITAGKTVSLSMTVQGDASGIVLSLMVMGNFPASRFPLLPDSITMMDGTGPGACQGQLVLQHPKSAEETAKAYRAKLEDDGFAFPDAEPGEVSFFIGYAPDCQIAMYLHPTQTTTMVVIRYLED